jgi:phage-related protein
MTTVGEVNLEVDADGKKLPAQVRKIAAAAAREGGKEFNKGFGTELSKIGKEVEPKLAAAGEDGGDAFMGGLKKLLKKRTGEMADVLTKAFGTEGGLDAFVRETGDIDTAMVHLRGTLSSMKGDLDPEIYKRMSATLSQYTGAARKAQAVLDAQRAATEKLRESEARYNDDWKSAHAEQSRRLDEQRAATKRWSATVNEAYFEQSQRLDEARAATKRYNEAWNEAHAIQRRAIQDSKAQEASIAQGRKSWMSLAKAQGEALEMNRKFDFQNRSSGQRMLERIPLLRRLSAAFKEYGDQNDRVAKKPPSFGGRRSLSEGQQILLIIAAIAAAAGELSVLGSAAGSSLVVLGSAAAVLGIGLGVAIAGFQGMLGDLSQIEPAARPAAVALKELGRGFSDIQNTIQGRMFAGLAGPIRELTDNLLPVLDVGLGTVADSVNRFFGAFAAGLTTPQALSEIQRILTLTGPILDGLGGALLGLGGALGNVFLASLPAVLAFSNGFRTMMDQFNAWTGSLQGQEALFQFFEHGQVIMSALLPLIGAMGQMLASLVTPETVAMTVAFLGNLTQFMPILGQILGVLAQLDVFGLISQLLLNLGQALQPILPALGQVAAVISGALSSAFTALAPMVSALLVAVMPLVTAFATFAAQILAMLIPAIQPLVGILTALIPPIIQVAQALLDGIVAIFPSIVELFLAVVEAILPILPAIVSLVELIAASLPGAIAILVPIISGMIDVIIAILPSVQFVIQIIADVIVAFAKWAQSMAVPKSVVESAVKGIQQVFTSVVSAIKNQMELVKQGLAIFGQTFEATKTAVGQAMSAARDRVRDAINGIRDAFNNVRSFIDTAVGFFQDLPGRIMSAISGIASRVAGALNFSNLIKLPALPFTATGGMFDRAQARIIGEAGPEAVVPLDRPLSQVDPAVRALSAVAQGKRVPNGGGSPLDGAGGGGSQRVTNFGEGSVVVNTQARDPKTVAAQLLDSLAHASL